jgi:hypothetical protein
MAWRIPTDAKIAERIGPHIDLERTSVGVVVGVIDDAGHRETAP